jgi:hypothetical protein
MTALVLRDQPQPKSRVEVAAIMLSAAGKTGDSAIYSTRPKKIALATRTFVQVSPSAFGNGKRQIMTALLIADFQIAASLPPLRAVWKNAAPTAAKLCENMRQLMKQSTLDFGWMLKQPRV